MTFDTSDQISPATSLVVLIGCPSAKPTNAPPTVSPTPPAIATGLTTTVARPLPAVLPRSFRLSVAETPGGPLFAPLVGFVGALATVGFAATVTSPFGWRTSWTPAPA